MQTMFNKNLEGIKNRQSTMNNTITEIKIKLEGTNSRIAEAAECICELKDRMVEITEAEQNKEKRLKRNEESLRDLWTTLNAPTSKL